MATSRVDALFDSATGRGQVLRFLVVGGLNTAVTSVAFYALATVLPSKLAFTLVYLAGIVLVVCATPRYVFGARATLARRIALMVWYGFTYLVGIGVIAVLEGTLDAPRVVVVLGTVCVTAPLSFLGARALVGGLQLSASGSGRTPSG